MTKEFLSAQACREHQQHCISSELKWKCDECGKSYKTKKGLTWHKSQHEEMPTIYVCRDSNCLSSYKSISELRKHCYMFDHAFPEVEGPVLEDEKRCEICYKVYQSHTIEFHMKNHQRKSSKTYECEQCDYKTMRKNNLPRHMETKHNTWNINFEVIKEHFDKMNTPYECPKCNKICESYDLAADHLKLKKCGEENICKDCNIKFTMKQSFKAHRKRKHPDSDK